jgi:hypothetical protein
MAQIRESADQLVAEAEHRASTATQVEDLAIQLNKTLEEHTNGAKRT